MGVGFSIWLMRRVVSLLRNEVLPRILTGRKGARSGSYFSSASAASS